MSKLSVAVFLAIVGIAVCKPQGETKNLIDVTAESVFNFGVLNNRKPVVAYFGNEGQCPPCKWVYPQLERLAKNRADKLYLAKVDPEALPDLARDYGVTTQPTIMIINQGEIVEVVEGPQWAKIVGLVNTAAKMES